MAAQPVLPTDATLDAEGRVAVDAPCVRCGYNLRTLKADALCPECAQPVSYSIQGCFLRFAPPRWVRGLARGLVLVLVALGGMIVLEPALSIAFSLPIALAASQVGPGSPHMLHILAGVQFGVRALLVTLGIIGLLRFTRHDPAEAEPEGMNARRIARLCCFLLPVPSVMNLVMLLYMPPLLGFMPGGPAPAPAVLGSSLSTLMGFGFATALTSGAIYAVTALALVRRLIRLMQRVPRPGLARFARIEFWGLLVSATLLLVGYGFLFLNMLPMFGPLMAATATMPSTMPAGATLTVNSWSSGTVNVAQVPLGATAATAPTSMPAGMSPWAALGYTTPASGPAASLPTTMPALPPFVPPASFFVTMIFAGSAGAAGGCGSVGFSVAGVVLLIMAASALFKAAREAEANVGETGPNSSDIL